MPRGVSTLVADPYEIANVLGLPGVELLLDEALGVPLDVMLRVPGRVPALPAHLETSGDELDLATTIELLDRHDAVCRGGDINPTMTKCEKSKPPSNGKRPLEGNYQILSDRF